MTTRAQVGFWLAGVLAFGLGVYLLRGILLPFVAGMAVAYLFDPVADRLERRGLSRTMATVVITALFVLVAFGALVLLLPLLIQQLVDFVGQIPAYAATVQEFVKPLIQRLMSRLDSSEVEQLREAFGGLSNSLVQWLLGLVQNLWQSGWALVNLVALLFITPIVSFYLLRDWDRIVERFDSLLPREHAEVIREQLREMDIILAGFVRGQGLVCLALAAFYAVALMLAGLDFGLIVGLGAGIVSFIPFVGAISGFIVGVTLALLQFDEIWRVFIVAAVFIAGQVLEGNILTPLLVGDRVKLHPVWVIFGALAGGALFGFVGVLLAVPASAVVGVLVRFAIKRYQASGMFKGFAVRAPNPGDDEGGRA